MKEKLALVFLVLLRLAIGWHFLFEAIEKHRSVNIGPSEISRPWTSAGFFREGQGPLGEVMRKRLGDDDEQALAKLTVRDGKLPEQLEREWDDYFQRFAAHYGLDAAQRNQAQEILRQQKERTLAWFTTRPASVGWLLAGLWSDVDRKPFKRSGPSTPPDVSVNISVSERVEEYRRKLDEYRTLLHDRPEAIGKDVEKTRRTPVRGEVVSLRNELLGLVNDQSTQMKDALGSVLTPEQKAKDAMSAPDEGTRFIRVVDWTTRWLLLLIGAGLLLGLFSRTSAFGGAVFLLMTVLTAPALPWLPAPPTAEGNYVFVNKNVIEMLALFMLAFIPTGRWFGIDALLHPLFESLNPFKKKQTA